MTAGIVLQERPEAEARARLAAVREALTVREAEVAQVRAALKGFDQRYLRLVGVLYAELDELEARIAEREVSLYDSDAARRRAQEARARAEETLAAAGSGELEPEELEPAPNLKALFREVARRVHPDFARDEAERVHLTRLMARANEAYGRGDLQGLERMLDDAREVEGGGELELLLRQTGHAERDLAALAAEEAMLLGSEIGLLFREAEASGRDLLEELAAGLRGQVAEARYRLEFVERQGAALVR